MIKNPNAPKIWGLLLAVVIVLALYAMLATQKPSSSAAPKEVSANNVLMKLISAHTEGSGYRVEVCYDLPDQRDWLLTYTNAPLDTTLSVASIEAKPIEEGTMYWKYDSGGKVIQRCQYLFFAIRIPAQANSVSLNIRTLYAREPGQSDYCLETSQKMTERNYVITIDCMEINNFEGLAYVKFPVELLSFDPVFKNIFRDVKWDTHAGPWSFTFPVNPP